MIDVSLLTYLEGFLTAERIQRFKDVLEQRTNFITVAIEDVFQLHNTSAVIRSCDAFGVQQVHVVEDRFGKRLDKNIAMGAEQWVDVSRYSTTQSCIQELREKGYQIVATQPHGNSTRLMDFTITKPIALFFGTEKEGLSLEVLQSADSSITIPMTGFTESLNISVAAAICLCHLTAILRKSDLPLAVSGNRDLGKTSGLDKKRVSKMWKEL